jgi:hypothetical protein
MGKETAAGAAPGVRAPSLGRLTLRWAPLAFVGVALAFLAIEIVLASTLPYRGWDPVAYGRWSRLIGLHGGFHQPGLGDVDLHRPLFYVLQGWVWYVAGFHLALGRLLSLGFTIVLVLSVGRLAGLGARRRLQQAVAVVLLVCITDLLVHAADGLTDVPAAAMVALTAVVLWTMRDSPYRYPLLGLASLLAVLAKPSGVVGVAALIVAQLIGPTASLTRRVVNDISPMAAGLGLGLVYDWTQARYLHEPLQSFMHSGVGAGIWADKAAAARPDALWGWHWLGNPLHVVLVAGIFYALLRMVGVAHRAAVLVGIPGAWVWAWVGPALGPHAFRPGLDAEGIATYVLSAVLLLAALAPPDVVPSRLDLCRWLVWATPPLLIWVVWAAYDTRLTSAAWPPLVLIMARLVTCALVGAAESSVPAIAVAAAAALVVLTVQQVYNLDGLGRDGWRQLRAGGLAGLGKPEFTENVVYGQFQYELAALRRELGSSGTVVGGDGRLSFFFPDRVGGTYPKKCADIDGYRAYVLLLGDESVYVARTAGAPATVDAWSACPGLNEVAEIPGNYAVFVNGAPRQPPVPSDCSLPPPPGGLAVVFGTERTNARAEALQGKLAAAGFIQSKVLRLNCQEYLVLETGVPDEATGKSIVAEARNAQFPAAVRTLGG